MDRNVVLFNGGSVNEEGVLEKMKRTVMIFSVPPSLNGIVENVKKILTLNCEFSLMGRYDAGAGSKSYYVTVPLCNKEDWRNYKECVRESAVKCAEVICTLGHKVVMTAENVVPVETQEAVTTCIVVAQEYARVTTGDVVVSTVVNDRGNGPLEIGGTIDEETDEGDYVSSSSDSEEEVQVNMDDEVEERNDFLGEEVNEMNYEFVGGAGTMKVLIGILISHVMS